MKLYADAPARRAWQIATDLFAVVWVWSWVWAARKLHGLVASLAEPGIALEDAGNGLRDRLLGAADTVDGLPLVGDQLRGPFDVVADAGTAIAEAGQKQQDVVSDLALALAGLMLVLALAAILFTWLPLRVWWIRRASAARALVRESADPSLFALRALANRPLRQLHRVHPDPATAWRLGDQAVIARLAALELGELGLRPPR